MGKGIWLTPPAQGNCTAQLTYYRLTWQESTARPEQAVHISANCRYKLWCNGIFVNLGPAKGDDRVWYYDTLDLAPYLQAGGNVLAVQVLYYPAGASFGNHSLFRAGRSGLWFEGIEGIWRCHTSGATVFYAEEERFAPLCIHEHAAPDPLTQGWQYPDFDDSGWQTPVSLPQSGLLPSQQQEKLLPRFIPLAQRTQHRFTLPVTEIPPHSETSFVLDAGEEMCAFLRLTVRGGRGARITLLQSECYVTPQGKANRRDAVNGHLEGYADTYTVGGAEEETYEPFWFRTFRYLQVTVHTQEKPLALAALTYEETGYPLHVQTSVHTDDESLDAIWDISLRTLRRCMHDTYMDCPFYEQLQYIMDTRSQILYTYAAAADDRLARQAIDDFSRAQRPDGLLNASYPNVNTNVIPGFSIYYILMLYDHMMYFGDKALVRRYLPVVERSLGFFAQHLTAEGLVDKIGGVNGKAPFWSFIDWARDWMPTQGMPSAGSYGPITMESLLYLLGLQRTAALCEWTGEKEAASGYQARAATLLAAIRAQCLGDDGLLADGPGRPERSQHAQVFGVLTGTLTPAEGQHALLCSLQDKRFTKCTVAMSYYLFRALEETGLYAHTDRCWDIWRRMLQNGCTTCVEAESYARSECHAWGALALYELPSVVLGVRPAAPGYEKIRVRPCPGYLHKASGTVHTPHGDVRVAWELKSDRLDLHIDASADVKTRITTE